jgi:hypothetical protein
MSSKGRGTVSAPHDFYRTPAFPVHRLLEAYALPAGSWFEPCAGEGDIIKAVNAVRNDIIWYTNEIRPECEEALAPLSRFRLYGDLLLQTEFPICHVYITNPPFTISLEIVEHLLKYGRFNHFIILQRLNWAAGPRRDLFRRLKPSTYVLPDRVSFTPDGKTDSTEYAWFVFDGRGEFHVLTDTPKEIRKRDREIMFPIVNYGICNHCRNMITSANGSKLRTGDLLHLLCNKTLDAADGNIVIATTQRENKNESCDKFPITIEMLYPSVFEEE